jgi:copper chaperone CopZ
MRTRARKTTYLVPDLNQEADAARIEADLLRLPYVERVMINLPKRQVTVTHRPDAAAAELVKEALIALGFAGVAKG